VRRRDFIKVIAGSMAAWPLAARAQEPGRIYRLAFLIPSPRQAPATLALFDELRRNGFSEGQNLVVIPDGFEADTEHPSKLAAVLVKAAPDAIITGPAAPLRAFQNITHTIPLIGMSEDMVADRVATVGLPSIFQFPEDAEAGALAGYGPRITDLYRQRARIAVQVLRGTRPADIPVQQPDRFELAINLKAAKAIGVEVPATLVARADKLIDERT
jgi:hypothetical protein